MAKKTVRCNKASVCKFKVCHHAMPHDHDEMICSKGDCFYAKFTCECKPYDHKARGTGEEQPETMAGL